MKPKSVSVFAPATIANIGPAFDVLGIAIARPGDIVTAARQRELVLTFSVRTKLENIPSDIQNNVAAYVASLMLDELKPPFGIRMVLHKEMPVGSGLGSSAASSVAAGVAVNALLPKPMEKKALLPFVLEGEKKASGAAHADNAAPSLLGGACLVRSYEPLDVVSLPIRNAIVWVVVHPHLVLRTEEARAVLPQSVPLHAAVHQWGNVAGLIAGLIEGNAALVGRCVEDTIVEPVRSHLIPGFYEVKQAALAAGAVGSSISGSGPSMFAVTSSMKSAKAVGQAMAAAFARAAGVQCDLYISRVNKYGARILRKGTR